MKTIMMCAMVAMMGCSATTSSTQPQVPTQEKETVSKKDQSQEEHPIIYKVAYTLADGTAFVFDEVEMAWKWIDTDEHKKQLSHAGEVIKSGVSGAYDAAKDEWNKK